MNFVQKPEIVKAVQWAGTMESLAEIAAMVASTALPGIVRPVYTSSGFSYIEVPISTSDFSVANIGDYVLLKSGVISVLNSATFSSVYNPVE